MSNDLLSEPRGWTSVFSLLASRGSRNGEASTLSLIPAYCRGRASPRRRRRGRRSKSRAAPNARVPAEILTSSPRRDLLPPRGKDAPFLKVRSASLLRLGIRDDRSPICAHDRVLRGTCRCTGGPHGRSPSTEERLPLASATRSSSARAESICSNERREPTFVSRPAGSQPAVVATIKGLVPGGEAHGQCTGRRRERSTASALSSLLTPTPCTTRRGGTPGCARIWACPVCRGRSQQHFSVS